jgi:hypothetical protein
VHLDAPFLDRNLGVALAAAEVLGGPVPAAALGRALESLDLAGRFQVIGGDPPFVLDAAHNPDGARALAEALAALIEAQPVVACLAILADKDAAGIVGALAPALSAAVCTEIPVSRPGAARGGAGRRIALPSWVRMDREARSELLQMMGLVAAVVAVVILVFFGLGYLFGRLFL